MEPNELKPAESQQPNLTNIPSREQPIVGQSQKFPKKLVLIALVALIVLLASGFSLSKTVLKQRKSWPDTTGPSGAKNLSPAEPKTVEQVFVSPVDGTKTTIKATSFYTVMANDIEYYGHVSKINNDYIRMLPTSYKKGSVLTVAGKELHGPEAATYFKVSKLKKFLEVTDTAIITALKTADATISDAFPSNIINKYVKQGQFQAYFFTDGSAFYAKTTNLDGTFLASTSHVYFLRSLPQVQPNGSTTATGISLALAKPEQYNMRTAADLLYWQNMKDDSMVAKAVKEFEKNQQ